MIASLGAVSPLDLHPTLSCVIHNAKTPRIATHRAILDNGATHVRLEVNLHFLTAVRTNDLEQRVHPKAV